MTSRRETARRVLDGAVCGHCPREIVYGDSVAICTACDAPHHADCWDMDGGCSGHGCPNSLSSRMKANPSQTPSRGHRHASVASGSDTGPDRQSGGAATPYECRNCRRAVAHGVTLCDECRQTLMPSGVYQGHAATESSGAARNALICGILGIICCQILSVVAIVQGMRAKEEIARNPQLSGAGMATAGIVLGWVGVAWAVLGMIGMMGMSFNFGPGF